jgi:hypothetical protein
MYDGRSTYESSRSPVIECPRRYYSHQSYILGTPTPVLLEVYTTDLVEIEPLSLSDHIEYLLRRPDLPADLRSHLESFTPSPPAAAKPVSAFSTFTAVYALVKLQRKTKKRYQAQREAIINELGL